MNISAATVVNFTFLGEVSARRNEADIRKINDESNSFEDLLSNEKNAKEIEFFNAPNRWTSERLYTNDASTPEGYKVNRNALDKVKRQLEEEGIDANSRTPTHEITDEQMEWLSSRYDLDFLSACSFTHEDYGNFMLDLAYLNVFSLDEVENMFGVMPFNANHKGYLYKMDTGDGLSGYVNPLGGVGNYVDQDDLYTQLIMEYLKVKCAGRTEKEYAKMAEDLAAQRAERLSLINELFARAASNKMVQEPDLEAAKPIVEDISERLREDFASR